MNRSSTSSSPTPPLPYRPTSVAATATRLTPAVIPLEYNYTIMSPSSYTNTLTRTRTTHRVVDSIDSGNLDSFQYSSIFGDPVPTAHPVEFLGSDTESGLYRQTFPPEMSSEEDGFNADDAKSSRIFSTLPITPSGFTRSLSSTYTQKNFEIVSGSSIPRLKPPDIQILPNSSIESGSDDQGSRFNFSLLRPEDLPSKPALYENINPVDIDEVVETVTISDATGVREYSEAKRRVSSISEDFRSNVGTTCHKDTQSPTTSKLTRRGSNDSFSSEDWFRPATKGFPEFSKMPKLRPSSKNVMLIKNSEMPTQFSPVAAMFNDSSSGDEHLADPLRTSQELPTLRDDNTPDRPPIPSKIVMRNLEEKESSCNRKRSITEQSDQGYFKAYPLADPPPLPPPPPLEKSDSMDSLSRLMSPVIKTNLIATGGDHRVATPRLHKKSSFTILPDKSPQSSHAPTPSDLSYRRQSPSVSSISAKPVAKPRYHLPPKSMSSTQLKLPQITQLNQFTSDDSPRLSVQFDMTGRYSPIKVPAKGILQNRESFSSSQDALPTTRMRFPPSLPDTHFAYVHKHRSYEALPLLIDPYRTSIPRLNRSAFDLNIEPAIFPPGALPRPLRPNPNPTRKHKGLLRVLNREEILSKIPLRSNWTSMDDIVLKRTRKPPIQRRRSSSTSPERRSSTQTASDRRSSNLSSITTSDFSFRRPSLLPNNKVNDNRRRSSIARTPITPKRRQSVAMNNYLGFNKNTTRTKISKPSTLSPIIGTPNKDSSTSQSPVRMMLPMGPTSESLSDTSRRDSLSKIPVRRGSQSSSRVVSRSSSPTKELSVQLPISGRTSQAASYRSPSRGSIRNESPQFQSRSPSRSTSRASTRPISQVASRSSSRQSSRMEQVKYMPSSRSTSRTSIKSTPRTAHASLSPQRRYYAPAVPANRKSISLSPQIKSRGPTNRGPNSPTKSRLFSRHASQARNREKSASQRNSRSRIPRHSSVTSGSSKSPPKSRVPILRGKKSSPIKTKPVIKRKEAASAKKAIPSTIKTESSVKRTPSSVVKQKPGTKKEPNVTKKTEKDFKKETLIIQRKPVNKRETSSLNLNKSSTAAKPEVEKQKSGKPLKKTPSSKSLINKATADGANKKLKDNAKIIAVDELKAIGATGGKLGAVGTVAAGATVAAAIASNTSDDTESDAATNSVATATTNMKRTPSTVSLLRMGSRMSLFGKKRPDSSLGRRITEEDLSDSTLPQMKASNKQSTPEAAAISERSQKTLEDVQKTVTVATDEIQTSIQTKPTDLNTLEVDAGKSMEADAISPVSSAATVIENTLGSQSVPQAADLVIAPVSPLPSGQPIEAEVSVINKEPKKNGTSERVSARAISVLPEVESESANLQNFELDVSNKSNAPMVAAGVSGTTGDVKNGINEPHSDDFKVDAKRRSPDGQGGSAAGSGEK